MRGDEVEFEWQSLVNPGVRVSTYTTGLTGIDDAMLADAPSFEKIARELRARLAGRVFVAHNVRFDYGFVRREFARLEEEWRSPHFCTVRLSRALYPGMPRHNLDAVMEHHGITVDSRHRALPDAQVLREFWRKVRGALPREELQTAIDLAAQRTTLPPALPEDLPDDLPEGPGVYRFFGVDDQGSPAPLYIGKANNLRERVLDHFRGIAGDARATKLAAEIRRVEWTEMAGELGASLLEAREVRERQPVYNRQMRSGGGRFSWLFDDAAGPPRLVELDADVLRTGNAFGTWRSERDARHALESIARERKWCLKLLGLESGEGSCFGLQVGRCNGACVGKEPPALHLARVKLGLMPQRLKPWPHEGPMLLREGEGEHIQYHLVDGWQHLGTVEQDIDVPAFEEFRRLCARGRSRSFDIDSYRILTRILAAPRYRPLPVPRS